ncbi:MAG: recombination protein RecR [Planctomycetes bacterium]|nr:recombination protein RecR [Planctomycetota bacterium]
MEGISDVFARLVDELRKLPGIGTRSAERMAYAILRAAPDEALKLASAIQDVKQHLRYCRICFHLTDGETCAICRDDRRDRSTICVVEQPKDVISIERAGAYRGLYHVLLGAFAPLEGVAPDDLTIGALMDRIRKGGVREVIIATNPNYEGDGTAAYLARELRGKVPRVTRIARGVPTGGTLEHANKAIVSDAIEGRKEI